MRLYLPEMHSDSLRLIFIHLPKTGGESVTDVLGAHGFHGHKHESYREFCVRYGAARARAYRVASFVRNPWDQVLSLYSHLRKPTYMARAEISPHDHYFAADGYHLNPLEVSRSACQENFSDWAQRWYGGGEEDAPRTAERLAALFPGLQRRGLLRAEPHAAHKRKVASDLPYLMPYLDWFRDRTGRVRTDFVGRFENLHEDYRRLTQWLGIEAPPLPHLNKSQRGEYRDRYDARSRDTVTRYFREEIETFDYRF